MSVHFPEGDLEIHLVVEEPFSDEVVSRAVGKWLRERGYEFGIKRISLEQARGSGMVRKLRDRVE